YGQRDLAALLHAGLLLDHDRAEEVQVGRGAHRRIVAGDGAVRVQVVSWDAVLGDGFEGIDRGDLARDVGGAVRELDRRTAVGARSVPGVDVVLVVAAPGKAKGGGDE